MAEHKHASVLRAIADGVPMSEFEVCRVEDGIAGAWQQLAYAPILKEPELWEIRRKPQYIMVNGFKVPKPLEAVPNGMVYTPSLMGDFELFMRFDGLDNRDLAVQRGIAHSTKDAAIAHAKAMLGIDPKWEE